MTTTQPWRRDPRNPGAPIIPRGEWDFPPYHRWTFQHIREMTPTANIWRGPGPVLPLPERRRDIDGITFETVLGRRTVAQWLEESATDGFMVLSCGEVVDERYMNGLTPYRQHLAMSVSKSVTSVVFGILVSRGLIDPEALVTQYLPELEATAYRGAKVQHVLDMTSGVLFDETYTAKGSHMQKLGQASGWFEAIGASLSADHLGNTQIAAMRRASTAAAAPIRNITTRSGCGAERKRTFFRSASKFESWSASGNDINPSIASRRKSSESVSTFSSCSSLRVKSPLCQRRSRSRNRASSFCTEGFIDLLIHCCNCCDC